MDRSALGFEQRGAPSGIWRPSPAMLFSHAMCIVCLLLQRFGLPVGHGQFFLCVVLAPSLVLILVLSGQTRISGLNAMFFGLMICVFMSSSITAILIPNYQMRFSFLSIGELLVIYTCFLLEPARGFDSHIVLRIFIFYARLIAILGLIQFGLQFAHVRLFSFAQIAPPLRPILTENGFHVVAPLKYGSSILRSNGFFLLEPSILSQMMAIAIIVDYFILNRWTYLPVYAAALLASFSGTGILALAITLGISGLISPRQIHRTVLFGLVALVVAGLSAVVLPNEFATLTARASGQDASASLRYGAQLEALKTILDDPRVVIGFGPGAADGFVRMGAMSPGLKLLFDYGIFGVLFFILFLLKSVWRADKPLLSIVCITIFQIGGGYLVFSPFVFLIALLCIWSKPVSLRPAIPDTIVGYRPRHGYAAS